MFFRVIRKLLLFVLFLNFFKIIGHTQSTSDHNSSEATFNNIEEDDDDEEATWHGDDNSPDPVLELEDRLESKQLAKNMQNKNSVTKKVFHYRKQSAVKFSSLDLEKMPKGKEPDVTEIKKNLAEQVKFLEKNVVSELARITNLPFCQFGKTTVDREKYAVVGQAGDATYEFDYVFYDPQLSHDRTCVESWQDNLGVEGLSLTKGKYDDVAALAQILRLECLPVRATLKNGELTLRIGAQAWDLDKDDKAKLGKEMAKKLAAICN